MDKKWPFGFFVYSSVGDKEDAVQPEETVAEEIVEAAAEEAVVEAPVETEAVDAEDDDLGDAVLEEDMPDEVVECDLMPAFEEAAEAVEVEVETETDAEAEAEEDAEEDVFDEDEDADLPDLEEELEIALEKNHQQEVKKQHLITGISAGVALLGAVGLATGLAIHAHFKKK